MSTHIQVRPRMSMLMPVHMSINMSMHTPICTCAPRGLSGTRTLVCTRIHTHACVRVDTHAHAHACTHAYVHCASYIAFPPLKQCAPSISCGEDGPRPFFFPSRQPLQGAKSIPIGVQVPPPYQRRRQTRSTTYGICALTCTCISADVGARCTRSWSGGNMPWDSVPHVD